MANPQKSYRIVIEKQAKRALERLPKAVVTRLTRAIAALADNPRPHGSRKLVSTGRDDWRIRVGNYRVVYEIYDDCLVVLIVRLGHRRDIYD